MSEKDFDGYEATIATIAKDKGLDLATLQFLGTVTHSPKTGTPFKFTQLEWSVS